MKTLTAFEFKAKGTLTVVSMERNLEYLTVGDNYDYVVDGNHINFTSTKTGGGTFAKVSMLNIFQKQGRIEFAEAPKGWDRV